MKKLSVLILFASICCGDDATLLAPGGGDAGAHGESATSEGGMGPLADASSDGGPCSAAKAQLLTPIDSMWADDVVVLSDAAGVKLIYVDASAGGTQASSGNPRVYIDLDAAKKVAVTDVTAAASTDWDLAIKRPILFTNGGDGGPGQGATAFLSGAAFDGVTAADVGGSTFLSERFFDAACNAQLDATGAVRTTFDGWYEYDSSDNTLSPAAGTWLVKGGKGKVFKIQVLSYYATPDGGVGQAGGRYTLKVAAL